MKDKRSHKINILETPISTISSAGHWFFATRESVEDYVPGILDKYPFEDLIKKAINWIDSADSLALLIYFALAFTTNAYTAALIAMVFHVWWYFNKSAFVNLPMTPFLGFINNEVLQVIVAGVALSFMGIEGMYMALTIGIIYFFLFKIGLLRRLWDKLDGKRNNDQLPLNDRVLKMVLIKYSIYEDLSPPHIKKLEDHVKEAVIEFNTKKKK